MIGQYFSFYLLYKGNKSLSNCHLKVFLFSPKTSSQELCPLLRKIMSKRLEGKVAIITGAASGIGETAARLFVQQGAKVIIADVQDQLGQAACNNIGSPDVISYVHCDVTSDTDVQNAVDTAVSKYGKLDIMYANAGIPGKGDTSILSTDYEDFKRVFDVNVYGMFLCSKHAARVMIPVNKGSIILTSSVASVTYWDIPHAYATSKTAVVGFTKNLCVELGKYGIRVNCISPFAIATPMMMTGFKDKGKETVEELVHEIANLKGTVPETKDVAEAALFLASNESKYISGQNIVTDGGYSVTNVALREGLKKFFS